MHLLRQNRFSTGSLGISGIYSPGEEGSSRYSGEKQMASEEHGGNAVAVKQTALDGLIVTTVGHVALKLKCPFHAQRRKIRQFVNASSTRGNLALNLEKRADV